MQMSLTRILREIKTLEERITKTIKETQFYGFYEGTGTIKGFKTNEEFREIAKQKYQSVKKLIENRDLLKTAQIKANAETDVTIGGKTMTIAQALEKKESIKILEQGLVAKLVGDRNRAVHEAEKINNNLSSRRDTFIKEYFAKDKKVEAGDLVELTKKFDESNSAKILDPLENTNKIIDDLSEDIQTFLSEVDYTLSELNARTFVEVEGYPD